MICTKCKLEVVQGAQFCPWCGTPLYRPARRKKRAGNGTGTAYRRGSGWTAEAVVGWRELPDDMMDPANRKQRIPIKRTKGGFKTKAEALAYIPTLKNTKDESVLTLQQVYDAWEPGRHSRIMEVCTITGSRPSPPETCSSAWTTAPAENAPTRT